jgi:hypothetical protein
MSRSTRFSRWLLSWNPADRRSTGAPRILRFRPSLETLEDRVTPSVSPVHLYSFTNSLADSLGGPALQADGGTVSGGRYFFGPDQGLRLSGGLADTSNYSVAFSVSLDSLSNPYDNFIKLLDFQQLSSDFGLYVDDLQHLDLYPGPAGSDAVSANQSFQVVLTIDSATGSANLYLNGVLERSYVDTVAIPLANVLTFFEDDAFSLGLESGSGSVDYIAIYSRALTASEVANLGDPQSNTSPSVSADHSTVSANENQAATNTGTWANAGALMASTGTVVQNANGTWSWSGTGDESASYTVTITASNSSGGTATTSFGVSFADVAPTVGADHSSVSAPENAPAKNTGTFADFDDAVTLKASTGTLVQNANGTWSWSGTGDDSAPYTVTITATNADGATATTSFSVSFTDVPPTVTVAKSSVSVSEGSTATNSGTFADYDDAVTLSASVGTVTQNGNGTWSWSFAATDELTQTVTITAANSDGSQSATTFNLVVNNVPPSITALSSNHPTAALASSNGQVAISGAFADPGLFDTHTVTVSWGDGSAVQTLTSVDQVHDLFNGSHTYSQGGAFTITVTVTDDDGGSVTGSTTAYVQGVGVAGGVLYVIGTSGADHVDINLIYPDNGGAPYLRVMTQFNIGPSNPSNAPSVFVVDPTLVRQIVVIGNGGNDNIVIHDDVTAAIAWLDAPLHQKHR